MRVGNTSYNMIIGNVGKNANIVFYDGSRQLSLVFAFAELKVWSKDLTKLYDTSEKENFEFCDLLLLIG